MAGRKKKIAKITLGIILVLGAALLGARIYLPFWLRDYINREIEALDGYGGSIQSVDVDLWRGAYRIHDLKIVKDGGDIPVPFVAVKSADLSLEWRALFNGAVVAEIDLYDADLNFAVGRRGGEMQTGEGAEWAAFVDAISPLDINRLEIHGGKVAFKDFSTDPQVDIYIQDIDLRAENLKDVKGDNARLPSPLRVTGKSIGGGVLDADGKLNIIKDVPDFDLNIRLRNAALPAINDYSRSVASVDFKRGVLNIFIEAAAKDGYMTGYIKPVAVDVEIVDVDQDKNPVNLLWESLVSIFAEIFENQPEDQIATRIELEGNINNPDTDSWSAIVGIFRNTFNAMKKDTDGTIDFSKISDG